MVMAYGNLKIFNGRLQMRTNGFSVILFVTVFLMFTSGCAYSIRYDGPYEGRIVDAETSAPIEGVVVLGVWYKIAGVGAGGASHEFYDAQETVTNKNGEFSIKGQGLKIMSSVETMNVLIFKSGYEYLGSWPWETFKEDEIIQKKISWEGEKPIVSLRKLTMEERKKRHTGKADVVPDAKQMLLIRESNKEFRELGIPLYPEVD